MGNKVYNLAQAEFEKIVKESTSYAECSRKIGYTGRGRYSFDLIKRRCAELKLSTEHFVKTGNGSSPKYTLDEILVENSTYLNIGRLKTRLIKEGKLEYKCAICGNQGEWMGEILSLQLDHINGNHTDHRITNLRFLCPNCHSQTETFCTRQPRAKSE